MRAIQILAAAMLVCAPAFAKVKTFDPPAKIIPVTELDTDLIKGFIEGEHPDIAIECIEGTNIPLEFFFNLDFFSVKIDPNLSLKAEKTTYIRAVKRKVYFSSDLVHWETKRNLNSGRTVTELKKGDSKAVLDTKFVPYSFKDDEDDEY